MCMILYYRPSPPDSIRAPSQMKLEEDLLPAGLEFREDG
jgi:hypothetical protein